MKITIVGFGYVGRAMFRLLRHHYHCVPFDAFPQESGVTQDPDVANDCDIAFICVPTPAGEDGSCDTSIVEEVIGWLETPLIVIKSTVPVGFTDRMIEETGKHVVFSPEYCGESSYWSSHRLHTEIVESPWFTFGGDPEATSALVDLFMPVVGPEKRFRQTTARVAEMAKYMENVFYASKITLCHEFARICEATGVDYNEAREAWLEDPRINRMHTAVFDKPGPPFAGKCLPKDTAAMVEFSRAAGYEPDLLVEVLQTNGRLARS